MYSNRGNEPEIKIYHGENVEVFNDFLLKIQGICGFSKREFHDVNFFYGNRWLID